MSAAAASDRRVHLHRIGRDDHSPDELSQGVELAGSLISVPALIFHLRVPGRRSLRGRGFRDQRLAAIAQCQADQRLDSEHAFGRLLPNLPRQHGR